MKKALCWIFGCIFCLVAILSLLNAHFISFLFETFIAMLLLPPASNFLREKIKINIPKWVIPTTISLYVVFVIAVGVINVYKISAPFIQPFVRMSQEVASFKRQPLPGITEKQREAVEKFQTEISESMNKIKTLNEIQNEKLKREKLLEYSADLKKLEVPKGLPTEVETLLIDSKSDFNTAFELIMKTENITQDDIVKMLNKFVDGSIKVAKASILVGVDPKTKR